MITWMQRHKKYLIVTIWISTIAFIGAGFVGWGQYSYGDKAGAVAKVGAIEISMGELQKQYSSLYNQYNQIFQGNFDEEKAKSFGLQQQALKQLVDQAYILNLAAEYDLEVTQKEMLEEIKSQEYFFKNGAFDKDFYKEVLSRNNFTMKEYEADVAKQLLIKKTLALLPVETTQNEANVLNTVFSIADKIEYKLLDDKEIAVDTSDAKLKPYWEKVRQNYMSDVSYDVAYIAHAKVEKTYNDEELENFYNDNKTLFKDNEGKILEFAHAKEKVAQALNDKASKNEALREYIAFKKNELPKEISVQNATISAGNNPFTPELLAEVAKLSPTNGFLKPVEVNGVYTSVQLLKINPAEVKPYEEVKPLLIGEYVKQQKKEILLDLAQKSYTSFKGNVTDFITLEEAAKLKELTLAEAGEFLNALFKSQNKQGYIPLQNGKVVVYNILEQKLLQIADKKQDDTMLQLKSAMFSKGLLENLQNRYEAQIFIEGI
ncbi:MAG: SurA N-terminal domain-containing protein [Thiovulaceae bacterium]|jgi:peptidyl-prolyl cis-trans isomerase D|nr:SurA N-terminal domain-containing protein [Sulfurimonadaceae bacterium]